MSRKAVEADWYDYPQYTPGVTTNTRNPVFSRPKRTSVLAR